ncbi:amidohydrolase family protein [Mucilaginibacter sp.]|uniref:amidohydrolase family protein n=1 Tax=Mucilaginibacter sp. TaxID=1882438 RepID=UPI00326417A6
MILNNVQLINGTNVSIRISEGKIARLSTVPLIEKGQSEVMFSNAWAFPGLINSHDHLDFNLFPQLGNLTYKSYTEWGEHIHKTYADEIAAGLKIPLALREQWGIYKNLLCGVTTVVNHGERNGPNDALISLVENKQDLHSVAFEKQWKKRLNNPLKINQPVVMHVGEGTNPAAHSEIDELIRWNLLHRKLIGIHGVALSPAQARYFKALVWCPQSNYFLLNATAPVNHLKKFTRILFGTDSTLTSDWNIWEHISLARETQMLSDEELFRSLTSDAANVWKLNCGSIAEGFDADLLLVKDTGNKGLDAFYGIKPEDILMVMSKGNIRLFDQSLYHQLGDMPLYQFSKVYSGKSVKYVQGDLPELMNQIQQYQADIQFPVYIPSEPAA